MSNFMRVDELDDEGLKALIKRVFPGEERVELRETEYGTCTSGQVDELIKSREDLVKVEDCWDGYWVYATLDESCYMPDRLVCWTGCTSGWVAARCI